MDVAKSQTMSRFLGVNNVENATRLQPLVFAHEYVYPLQQANNVDIDNSFGISSRPGYDDVLSGTDIHSLWSDGAVCFFVDGTVLKRLNTDYTATSLQSSLTSGARMSYAPVNDRVYYSNGYEIGYVIGSVAYALTDPALQFKRSLPAGQLVEYFQGCLYVAKDNILYASDPLCDYYDVRSEYRVFASRITLLRAVDDGLYVGDKKIWWVAGKAMVDFERVERFPHPAIPNTDMRISGQFMGDGVRGNIAIWTGETGICTGDNDGNVVDRTGDRFTFSLASKGAAFLKENGHVRRYINSLY